MLYYLEVEQDLLLLVDLHSHVDISMGRMEVDEKKYNENMPKLIII